VAGTGKWISGGLIGLLGFFGLFAASRAVDSAFYVVGWIIFFGSLAYIFGQIASYYNKRDAESARNGGAH